LHASLSRAAWGKGGGRELTYGIGERTGRSSGDGRDRCSPGEEGGGGIKGGDGGEGEGPVGSGGVGDERWR
jgi:hypothetical protein